MTRQTEAQVRRAVAGAIAAGLTIGEVIIENGKIRILPKAEEPPKPDQRKPQAW